MKPLAAPRVVAVFSAILFLLPAPAARADDGGAVDVVHTIVFYIPNRVFDLVDVVRVRARVGPGVAGGVRATEAADLYFGSYTSVYAGLPGPRMGREIPLPAGLESKSGVEASLADPTLEGPPRPRLFTRGIRRQPSRYSCRGRCRYRSGRNSGLHRGPGEFRSSERRSLTRITWPALFEPNPGRCSEKAEGILRPPERTPEADHLTSEGTTDEKPGCRRVRIACGRAFPI